MHEDKTPAVERIKQLCWLYRAHQAYLPFGQELTGWLRSATHSRRKIGDYCPFNCPVCDEQRLIDVNASAEQVSRLQ